MTIQYPNVSGNYEYRNDRNDKPNQALYFTGDDCTCANNVNISRFPNIDSFTIAFWVRYPSYDSSDNIINIRQQIDDPSNQIYMFDFYSTYVYYYDAMDGVEVFDYVLNSWSHIALVRNRDENKVKIYRNGEEISSITDKTSISFKPEIFSLGGYDTSKTSCGKKVYLDDLRIYTRALTVNDIIELSSNKKVFLSSCSEASKDTTEHFEYTLDTQNICAENTCVEAIQSIQKTYKIGFKTNIQEELKLKDLFGYDTDCFDLYTKLSTDNVGPGDLNVIKVSTMRECPSPCDFDFTFFFAGTSHTLFKTKVAISFAKSSQTDVIQSLISSSSVVYPQYFQENTISTTRLDISFATFEARKQPDYSTIDDISDKTFDSYVYYVFTTDKSGLNLKKSDIQVKFIDPTYTNSQITVSPDDFDLENGTAADSYNLKIKGKVIGTHKVLVQQI